MAVVEPSRARPATAADVHEALMALDALVRELEDADAERARTALPELERRVEAARELSETFARALGGWADPATQANLRSVEDQIASGSPLATIPVEQAVADLRRRLADDDA